MSLCTVSVHHFCVHPKSYTIRSVPSTAFWKIANKYWIFLSTNNTFAESHSFKYKILTWYCSVKLSRHEDWRFCQCCLSQHRLHQLPVFLFVLSCLNLVATLFGRHWIRWFANACSILFWSWLSWYDTPPLHPLSIEIMVSLWQENPVQILASHTSNSQVKSIFLPKLPWISLVCGVYFWLPVHLLWSCQKEAVADRIAVVWLVTACGCRFFQEWRDSRNWY
jgi:hypothetical protein